MKPRFNQVGLYISIFIVGLIATGNDSTKANCDTVSQNALEVTCLETVAQGRNFTYLALTPKTDPNLRILTRNGDRIALIGLEDGMWIGQNTAQIKQTINRLFSKNRAFSLTEIGKTRHGDLSGQVFSADGIWLQRHLLELGLTRFTGGVGRGSNWRALLEAEESARRSRIGLWKDKRMKPHDAAEPKWIKSGFTLVEGTVLSVAKVRDRLYLNFGANWREDFSAELSRAWQKRTPEFPFSVAKEFENQRVRLRGMVRLYNGPYMPVHNLDQIEILSGFPPEQLKRPD